MKAKNLIKILDSITNIFKLSIELEQKQIEKLALTPKPIPDYSKGKKSDGLMIVADNKYSEHIFDNPNAKEEVRTHFADALKMALEKKQIKFPDKKETDLNINEVKNFFYENGFRSGKSSHIEYWNKQLNDHLKSKSVDTSEPFAMAPIEDKKESKLCPRCQSKEICITSERTYETNEVISHAECEDCHYTWNFTKEPKINYNILIKGSKSPIAPPLGFNHNFQKRMLQADKELQKICKTSFFEINNFEAQCPKCTHRYINLSIDLKQKTTQCKNCYSCFSYEIINNKIMIKEID